LSLQILWEIAGTYRDIVVLELLVRFSQSITISQSSQRNLEVCLLVVAADHLRHGKDVASHPEFTEDVELGLLALWKLRVELL